jgi:hypothetical protein
VRATSGSRLAVLLCAAVLAAACSGGSVEGMPVPPGDVEEPTTDDGDESAEGTVDASTMPDVIGTPVDEAVAQLEELGFRVSTGLVRTTEMDPDLVYRSEPSPGRQVQEGQRVTLRVAAEPRA